ncbi:AFR310Cp [Eremothecium gossypii ATCC 10895]|uniref:AFR310Cp n=1 Tax=Eremothecium gossypii (strain ATCC 10895 / CBS 109.51 / FGSC 9923 / NRRL Y-1056) TaxID=284811 RepID=Q753K2_EREGS|nr:AFR310Cp [Eremothecium gossypii ATCC 10895]AAS53681.2 AFR310Cp [Eremothecium gossypii ATCC 10895]AEY97994.1 FAFR310Cp [Eremothecium gossypii FDAG1]
MSIALFKKKLKPADPFEELSGLPEEKKKDPTEFLRQSHHPPTGGAAVTGDASHDEYYSPFRDAIAVEEAQRLRNLKFPTTGTHVTEEARRRVPDIDEPKRFSTVDERQRQQLQELELKEGQLRLYKESQKIVDVRGKSDVTQRRAAQNTSKTSTTTGDKGALGDDDAVLVDYKSVLIVYPSGTYDGAYGPVTDRLGGDAKATTQKDVSDVSVQAADKDSEEGKPLLERSSTKRAAETTERRHSAGPLSNIMSHMPFKLQKGGKLGGLFKHHDKEQLLVPNGTPEEPEVVLLTNRGYMSKAVYDRLNDEEKAHLGRLVNSDEDAAQDYQLVSQHYEKEIADLDAEISKLRADITALQAETEGQIDGLEASLSKNIQDMKAENADKQHVLHEQAEAQRAEQLADKEEIVHQNQELQPEIDRLRKLKENTAVEITECQARIDQLQQQLDAQSRELRLVTDQQAEVSVVLATLQEQKAQLEREVADSNEFTKRNREALERLNQTDYTATVREIDAKNSEILTEIAKIRQEIEFQRKELVALKERPQRTAASSFQGVATAVPVARHGTNDVKPFATASADPNSSALKNLSSGPSTNKESSLYDNETADEVIVTEGDSKPSRLIVLPDN